MAKFETFPEEISMLLKTDLNDNGWNIVERFPETIVHTFPAMKSCGLLKGEHSPFRMALNNCPPDKIERFENCLRGGASSMPELCSSRKICCHQVYHSKVDNDGLKDVVKLAPKYLSNQEINEIWNASSRTGQHTETLQRGGTISIMAPELASIFRI